MLKPNDVVVILRPELTADNTLTGDYKLIHGMAGPVTMDTEDSLKMLSIGMMMVAMLSYLEDADEKTAKSIQEYIDSHFLKQFNALQTAVKNGSAILPTSDTMH